MSGPNPSKQAVRDCGVFRHRLAASISAEIRHLRSLSPTQQNSRAMANELSLLQRAFELLSIPKADVTSREERETKAREQAISDLDAAPVWGELLGEK